MARFNTATKGKVRKQVRNLAGGLGYSVKEEAEFAGIAFTSFAKDEYYRKFPATIERMNQLIDGLDPLYVAQVCYAARNKYGMRSISHIIAALNLNGAAGKPWAREFYRSIIVRPDDITEILALCNGEVSHAMRKGFADRLSDFNAYQIAKYQKFDREWNLNDAVRLCHPKPTEALTGLMRRKLRNTDTWEAMGNSAETWRSLLSENKLGYLALLRNVRNIAAFDDAELTGAACVALCNGEAIMRSRIFPFQFMTAYNALIAAPASFSRSRLLDAVVLAADMACANMPKLEGRTIILNDQSGSMCNQKDTAALFCAVLYKACNALVINFDTRVKPAGNLNMPVIHGAASLLSQFGGGGTDFVQAFKYLSDRNLACDRIFVITDEQHWVGGGCSYGAYQRYCSATGCEPQLWSIDLASYGTSQFPSSKVRQLWGFSEKMFDLIAPMELDPGAFVDSIKGIRFERKTA
jgi:60 kDa SS-A/Ro ribonucleoprotein